MPRKVLMSVVLAAGALPALAGAAAAVPDLSGPWQLQGSPAALTEVGGRSPPLLPAARQIYAAHRAAIASKDRSFDPMQHCLPPGVPRLLAQPFPWSIVQGPRHYLFVFEWNHLNRNVYMGEAHFEGIGPTYLGQSVGHWEGATLVVDTSSYNDKTLLDDSGLPHSDELHTVERYRLAPDGQTLQLRITIADPKTFARSWDAELKFSRRAGAQINEDYCLKRMGLVK